MSKRIIVLWVCILLLSCQGAFAAPVLQMTQEVEIVADNAVTPLDTSYCEEPQMGQLEFYDLKNLYGAGAKLRVYVNTDTGKDSLIFDFGGGMIEVRLQNRNLAVVTERFTAVTKVKPMVVKVEEGILTVKIGDKSKQISNVQELTGTLTTQSISGKVKVYQFIEQNK